VGSERVRDGNGDGSEVVDIGALEYQRLAPTAAIESGTSAVRGLPLGFAGVATDPDPGDPLGYAWRFSDGGTASGARVDHAFTTLGPASAALTVSDPTGLTAAASRGLTVVAPGDTGSADRVKPVISRLRVRPRIFRRGRSKARISRLRTGTRISFRLSEPAAVTLTFARVLPGRRVGGRCVRATRARAGRPRCLRRVTVKPRLRFSGRAGVNRVRFSGRLSARRFLRRGRHRVTVGARDAAGNRALSKRANLVVRVPR
jgi:hypothetical protein